MAMLTDEIQNLFQSQRLHYVRADETDEDYLAFQIEMLEDPTVNALVSDQLLRPQGKKDAETKCNAFSKALLGVVICLLPEERQPGDEAKTTKPMMIGQMNLRSNSTAHHQAATIGISISSKHQNKGYGREAINWMLDWAFRHGNQHTVGISTASFNTRALALYENMGFVFEGRRRQIHWFNRGWHDEAYFSMIEDEWEKLRGIEKAK